MNKQPGNCPICGQYLTTSKKYAGQRCLNPGHWQAVGLLVPTDYYAMARIVAQAQAESNRHFLNPGQKRYWQMGRMGFR
jgi:hypothetical protein